MDTSVERDLDVPWERTDKAEAFAEGGRTPMM